MCSIVNGEAVGLRFFVALRIAAAARLPLMPKTASSPRSPQVSSGMYFFGTSGHGYRAHFCLVFDPIASQY
jgi:hypothetical protein